MDTDPLRQALIDQLKSQGNITDPRVEAAFRSVPRHLFLPGVPVDEAYRDRAIVTKRLADQPVSSSSQPAMMAIMLEQLDLQPGQRVLEIGAGTGYNAALIAYLVGDAGQVVTVDLDDDIAAGARAHLLAAGYDRVKVVYSDGVLGYAEAAPYDRIILTVGAWDIAPAWLTQLTPRGRLVLPLSIRVVQESVALEQTGDHLASVSIKDGNFMLLRGPSAGPDQETQLGPEAGLHITSDVESLPDTEAIYRLLTGPSHDQLTTIQVTAREVWGGLSLWLALHEPGYCSVWAEGEIAARGLVPHLFAFPGNCISNGVARGNGLGLLMRPQAPAAHETADPAGELSIRSYGTDETLARHLLEQIAAWDAAGRPGTNRLRMSVYPPDVKHVPATGDLVIQKHWSRLVLSWQT